MNIQLSKSEVSTISKLPPSMQEQARKEILARKEADRAAHLAKPEVQARLAQDKVNRSQFRFEPSRKTATVGMVYGIGRKFPVALHKSEWIALFANIDAIKQGVALLPEEK